VLTCPWICLPEASGWVGAGSFFSQQKDPTPPLFLGFGFGRADPFFFFFFFFWGSWGAAARFLWAVRALASVVLIRLLVLAEGSGERGAGGVLLYTDKSIHIEISIYMLVFIY
jgi:hypothetical protein